MVASVELVLERGERLELLVDKTDNLQQQVLRGTGITVVLYCCADRATFSGGAIVCAPLAWCVRYVSLGRSVSR